MLSKAKYLSLVVLLGAWGCTTNQSTLSGYGDDDLYGGNSGAGIEMNDRGADRQFSRSDNPDYSYTGEGSEGGTSDYYDDSYLSSKSVRRAVGSDVGYNAGFADGYSQASASNFMNNPYGGFGSYWPGSAVSMGLQFGLGNSFRMRPYAGFGYGSMLGYGGMMGYGSMMGYGFNDPFYSPWGYSPYSMYSPYGSMYSPWGYDSMYGYGYGGGYGGYGGYGYNPWAYGSPVVIVNNSAKGVSRTYGPRVVSGGSRSRSSERYNSNFVNSSRAASTTGDRNSRRSGNAISAGSDTYSSPRSSRSYNRGGVAEAGGRTSADYYNGTRGESNNTYYSRPRTSGSTYSTDGAGSYSTPRSSRGYSSPSNSTPTYSVPSRSQSDYSAPSRTYSAPSRSADYSAPSRSYSAPSYSAPSRSYSAPSGGGGGGGGATRSSSRGPR
ncbi:hypothetical protein HWI92_01105 [Dyadobacter sandarakinus]|uniref:Prolyl-tRNA synthetase n=2 Tax=Dyadobacter sandarakinus TaxID=2747268 RepID=A0ABX7ICZ2_9BACT|nr:hypothetical protein HWI92_01105 [Dyadobacter sandarakinus]